MQACAPRKKFRFRNKLLSLDATVIELCASMFDWARFRATKGALKLHLLLDHWSSPKKVDAASAAVVG